MIYRSSILLSISRAGLFNQASWNTGFGSCRALLSPSCCSENADAFPDFVKNSKSETPLESSTLGNLALNFGFLGTPKNVSFPHAYFCSRCIHSGPQDEFVTGRTQRSTHYVEGLPLEHGSNGMGRSTQRSTDYVAGLPLEHGSNGMGRSTQRSTDYVAGLHLEHGNNGMGRLSQRSTDYVEGLHLEHGGNGMGRFPVYPQRIIEGNADIVHMKLMRNNAFVTLTDSKGNKKLGISAGKLAGKGGKLARYSAESAAEDIGQKVRQMKIKSVVVKVNGTTFFRKKKLAILSFKDGYSHSRAESNPIVYIEDSTQKPHNGCRRKKQRRI